MINIVSNQMMELRFMNKIKITFVIQQTDIRRIIREPLELRLDEDKSIIDAIRLVDEEILKRAGKFPIKGYKSLLHMVYHPFENRFYKQVAIQGYLGPGSFLNIREKPKAPLLDDLTVILAPEGPAFRRQRMWLIGKLKSQSPFGCVFEVPSTN